MIALDDMVDAKAMVRVIDRFVEVTDLEKLGFEKTRTLGGTLGDGSPVLMEKG